MDADHVDAIKQILAEMAFGHLVFQIAMRRRDDARVKRMLGVRADRTHHSLLQDAQQFGLHLGRHLTDLVEEQRPPAGLHEEAPTSRLGVGECTAHVTKQLALEQVRRHRRAVDGHERPASALLVQRTRHELLSGPRLTSNQDRCVALRYAVRSSH